MPRTWASCWPAARGWRCWPPAARCWGCAPSGSTRCRRWRCMPIRAPLRSRRWRPRRRWRCSWTGPARCGQDLPSPRATRWRWRRSAAGWRGFRWRSSWPPPAPGCWTRPRCWTGWRPRWTRSAPARWISPSGSGPCAPPWSGASASWKTPSVRCWRSRRCSPTAGPSRPPARWRAWMRTGRWSCVRRWPGTAWSLSTAPGSGPGRGCWRPSARSWPSGWRPGPTPPRSAQARWLLPGAGRAGRPAAARPRPERMGGAAGRRGGQPGRRGALVPGA